MSIIEVAVTGSKRIEKILKEEFNAEGKGLHEYLTSVEKQLPAPILKKARYVASVRNKVVHEDGNINDLNDFNQSVDEVVMALETIIREQKHAAEKAKREAERKATSSSRTSSTQTFTPGLATRPVVKQGISGLGAFLLILISVMSVVFGAIGFSEVDNKSELAQIAERKSRAYKRDIESLEEKVSKLQSIIDKQEAELKGLNKRLTGALNTITSFKQPTRDNGATNIAEQSNIAKPVIKPEPQQSKTTNSLLAKAKASGSEFDQAKADLQSTINSVIHKQTQVKIGELQVSQESDGTYSVRVPVSWRMSETPLLRVFNKYFNGYNGSELKLRGFRWESSDSLIEINERNADASDSKSPFSGRLYDELQKIDLRLVATIGSKSGHVQLAGNMDCHVSCRYSERPNEEWKIQVKGNPGESTLSRGFENPIVIEGLTEQDLRQNSHPVVKIIQG